ncbi:phosphoribosyltransferase [Pseudomonas aeruginosa]|uniref:phosphoribosyltransferase n=1 Tax=Gammaproteobacteria TaxID=1236 RepID=UPI0015F10254|nr:phosphoribosyltransferase [Pseudomonas aeruginosa]MBA4953700.1 phosphoribosyltransferase [Pseudomonas aeruginosa]HDX2569716.1 phosphoribosyltransferase [Escherichia coli]
MSSYSRAERAPWGDFPKVVRNGDLGSLTNEPEYQAAKQGDAEAALNLVERLISDDTVAQLKTLIGDDKPRIVPVLAVEAAGNNKIPAMMAVVLADRLGLEVETDIVQREKVARTGAGSDHRLAFNPTFEGGVIPGQKYIVVDDTLTMGGTIASLRGYIENNGGKVMAASVMTAHEGALDLAVKPKMLAGINEKHGPAMDAFWKETFGYGIDRLTQGEAGHLRAAPSVDAIRDRIAAARNEAVNRVGTSRTATPARAGQQQSPAVKQSSGNSGEDLLQAAQEAETEQQALLESAPIEQTYQQTLALYVQAKHDQVERIEDRLEQLVDRQQARLQQLQSNAPGLLSLPRTKAAWQQQQAQQQARLQTLHTRLDMVREIKEGMGIHAPKIEELATRKMRAEHPELAGDWDSMREAARRHQALMRKQEQEKKQAQERERGRSQSLGLSNKPS